MALQIKGLEPVEFGNISEVPVITAELNLRLGILKFHTVEQITEAKRTLASAFPNNESAILAYMESAHVPTFELVRLQAYLQGGDKAVDAYDASYKTAIDKALDGASLNG